MTKRNNKSDNLSYQTVMEELDEILGKEYRSFKEGSSKSLKDVLGNKTKSDDNVLLAENKNTVTSNHSSINRTPPSEGSFPSLGLNDGGDSDNQADNRPYRVSTRSSLAQEGLGGDVIQNDIGDSNRLSVLTPPTPSGDGESKRLGDKTPPSPRLGLAPHENFLLPPGGSPSSPSVFSISSSEIANGGCGSKSSRTP
jgi:hypothetical protein